MKLSTEQAEILMEKAKLWEAVVQLGELRDMLKKEVPHCLEAEFMVETVIDLQHCMKSAHQRLSIK